MTNESQLNLRTTFRRQTFQLSFFGGGGVRRGGGQETLIEFKNIPMMKCETHMLNE